MITSLSPARQQWAASHKPSSVVEESPGGPEWTPELAEPELVSSERRIQKHESPYTGFMQIKADANCSRAPRSTNKSPRQACSWALYVLTSGRPGHLTLVGPRFRPGGRAVEALWERDLLAQKLAAVSTAVSAASFAFASTAHTGGFSVPRTIEGCTSPPDR